MRILLRNAPVSILFDLRAVFSEEFDPELNSDLVILQVVEEPHADSYAAGLTGLDAACYVNTGHFCRAGSVHGFGY
ncbi:hypothetical protein PSE10A_55390 [Pseudomonas amygdali pv. eriobotryae]|uniref:Uncharacterized protein n=1 Tax=Pseudomonas amygdali pv. eriobotryae TaxID=129137 RepID=A0A9P3AI00_PSEA0|nr:hypothetical protein PSE10A_55390 [Pseudomonas amygdali pv. eriobotryae]